MRKATLADSIDVFSGLCIISFTHCISFIMWIKYLPETVDIIFHDFPFGWIILIFWTILLFGTFWKIKMMLNLIGELYFYKSEENKKENGKRKRST